MVSLGEGAYDQRQGYPDDDKSNDYFPIPVRFT
jgi:hypothetical protein